MSRRHGRGNTPKLPVSPLGTQGGKPGMGRCDCPSPLKLKTSTPTEQEPPTDDLPIRQQDRLGGMG